MGLIYLMQSKFWCQVINLEVINLEVFLLCIILQCQGANLDRGKSGESGQILDS